MTSRSVRGLVARRRAGARGWSRPLFCRRRRVEPGEKLQALLLDSAADGAADGVAESAGPPPATAIWSNGRLAGALVFRHDPLLTITSRTQGCGLACTPHFPCCSNKAQPDEKLSARRSIAIARSTYFTASARPLAPAWKRTGFPTSYWMKYALLSKLTPASSCCRSGSDAGLLDELEVRASFSADGPS